MNDFKRIENFIKKVPKSELHLHIEGSLEPELMFKLSKRNKVEIPFKSIEEIKSAYNFSNLDSFLKIYYEGSNVLISEEDFFDLTWEYILRCKQDNIVHAEIFFDPQSHTERGIEFNTVLSGIHKALEKANSELGITSKIIMCFLRHLDEEPCFQVLKEATKHKDKIIGVGLDSSEKGNPPQKFKNLFEAAIKEGFLTVAHAGEEGPPEYIWDSLNLLKANSEFNITSKIIMCFLRHLEEEPCFEILNQAAKHKDKIIAVGLDSSEKGNPPQKFKNLFEKAIQEGFLTVAHAGEEGPPEYIWDSLKLLKVKRIDHGVQCLKDSKLVDLLKKNQTPLTVCPLSNIKLCVFDRLENHNLKKMLDRGLRVMVNSDDPAYFGGYLNTNLVETSKALNLSLEDVKVLIKNSFKSSFLDENSKKTWLSKI